MFSSVQVFLRVFGMFLLAAVWVPANAIGYSRALVGFQSEQLWRPPQRTPIYAAQAPGNGAVVSHFRSSGFFGWFSVGHRQHTGSSDLSLNGLPPDPENGWQVDCAPR